MAFLLLQTAIVANDAYVTLNRGVGLCVLCSHFWSSQMTNFQKNIYPVIGEYLYVF